MMMNSKLLKVILIVSGLVALAIGATILFSPQAFYETNGIMLGNNTSLINEIKAPAGALVVFGIFIMLGAFIRGFRFTSIVMATALYLAYGLSRLLSISVDGMPAESLVQAAIIELVIGLVCVFALVKFRVNRVER